MPNDKHESAHGGDIRALTARRGGRAPLDYSANLNPFGPPAWLADEVLAAAEEADRYPDPRSSRLREAAARRWRIGADSVVCANGSDELLRIIPRAVGASSLVVPVPSYSSYRAAALPRREIALREERGFRPDFGELAEAMDRAGPGALLMIGAPNNPTGVLPDLRSLRKLAEERPDRWVVADEAFMDFVSPRETAAAAELPNLIAVRSLTKYWSVPGARIGLALCVPAVARALRRELSDWPLGVFGERVGTRALADDAFDAARSAQEALRKELAAALAAVPGIAVAADSRANFLLLKIDGTDSKRLEAAALARGVAVRDCGNFPTLASGEGDSGKPFGWIRVAVRTREENGRLLSALAAALEETRAAGGR